MRTCQTLVLIVCALMLTATVSVGHETVATEPEQTKTVAKPTWVEKLVPVAQLRAGLLWNTDREEWTGYVTAPLVGLGDLTLEGGLEINPNEEAGPTGGIVALTYDMGSLEEWGIDVPFSEHIGLNVGPFLRYDFATGETEGGAAVSVIDLSFSSQNGK